jgi:type IV secretion system protein VirB10
MAEEEKDNNEPGTLDLPEVKDELSKVSVNPKQNLAILVAIAVIGAFVIFNLFFSGSKNQVKPKSVELPKNIVKPNGNVAAKDISVVKLPDLPSIIPPAAPQTSPLQNPNAPLPPVSNVPLPSTMPDSAKVGETAEQKKQRMDQKNKAPILSIGTGGQAPKPDPSKSGLEVQHVQYEPDYLIASGKIIDANLETSINSDTGVAQVRAIVSRDVYSESGKNILIPKGSKIFGVYSADMRNSRVNIAWKKIYLNTGIIIDMDAQLVDNLGRSGAEGRYDPKNKEKFANAVMTSAFSILAAKGIDSLITPADSIANQGAAANTATQIRNQAFNLASQNPNPTRDSAISTVNQICSFVQNSIPDKTSGAYTGIVTQCQALQLSAGTSDPKTLISQAVAAANNAADQLITNSQNTQTKTQQAATDAYNNVTKTVSDMFSMNFSPTVTIAQGRAIKIEVMQNYIFPKNLSNKVKIIR